MLLQIPRLVLAIKNTSTKTLHFKGRTGNGTDASSENCYGPIPHLKACDVKKIRLKVYPVNARDVEA